MCRWKQVVIGHSARTLHAYFAIFFCSLLSVNRGQSGKTCGQRRSRLWVEGGSGVVWVEEVTFCGEREEEREVRSLKGRWGGGRRGVFES